jgi:glycosyltransferase involved in cell wall biosynthesis
MSKTVGVSVVIPTIGRASLTATIDSINSGSCVPDEIVVCIPVKFIRQLDQMVFPSNVKIVYTEFSGQVKQRSAGFRLATNELVMQIDDDITIGEDALEKMLDRLALEGAGTVVAPMILNALDKRSFFRFNESRFILLRSLYHSLVGGLPWGRDSMGKYSKLTDSMPMEPSLLKEAISQVQWLPGGIVLGNKNDLYIQDFYPFSGKAYCEDLLHSHIRNIKDTKHLMLLDCFSYTFPDDTRDWAGVFDELRKRYLISQMMGAGFARAIAFIILKLAIYSIKKLGH